MFLFKNKKKKKSTQDLSNQDSVSNDVYVQDDHLLNIKLPDDFSSIILPQLIGYEQDENGNTINSSTIILRQKQQQQQQQPSIQPEEDHHPTREGWYPVTRLVGCESNRGTLVDTTNITAASLVQVNKRQSASLSSGDTLTCHSKEDSLDDSHPSLSNSEHDSFFPCMSYLQKDRPKFKRNHPRFTVLRESPTDFTLRSPNSGTLIKLPTLVVRPQPTSCLETQPTKHIEEDSKPSKDKRTSREKMPSEPPLKLRPQGQRKKRASVIMPSVDDSGSMIPRRPLSCLYTEKPSTTTTPKMKKTKQTRTMTINNTMGGGSRIPVRSQTMKV